MQITVLSENTAGGAFLAEHGLSYLIEHNERKILLDTGHSDVYLKNAAKLGVDIEKEVDILVLSHGHWDHGNGLEFIRNKKLLTHPLSFIKRYRAGGSENIGISLTEKQLDERFDLITSDQPYEIFDGAWFLGSIPRLNNFEAITTPFEDEGRQPDFILDDSALAFVEDDKMIVVTGCSHSGICNIIEYAKEVTGVENVQGVIGGFHLKQDNMQTKKTVDYLKNNNVKYLYPSHCTALPALSVFYKAFEIEQVKTGMVITI